MFAYFIGSVVILCIGIKYIILNRLEKLQADYNSLTIHDAKDGVWTQWGSWDSCSATCGGGIKSRTRTCSDPTPSPLGKFCDGEGIQYGPCSQNACPCADLTSNIETVLQRRKTDVAFTAYLSKEASQLSDAQIIPFDEVILNEGQGFNTNTHMFTCPVTGTYTFQTALLSPGSAIAITEIVKEGNRLVQAHAEPGATHAQGFNSVVTKCNEGENVWVRICVHGNAVYSDRFTTFSGFLLWEGK
ncbi:cerebellin-1-like [Mercenaria mercenaria]|uniref:cerebellin-1-like n=1 Tax=Mercenaria mercenaria TaxID=6596 RepID=UPI00234EAB37|nr:cerebellin-1-like [Mercenaria mercenaria]